MKENVGTIDMVLRIVVGAVLLAFAVTEPVANWWGWIGLIPLATGAFRRCPAYALLGTDTCGTKKQA
ncbi:hypothetical protein AN478_08520 [Thiohalorhabdus denitrificans]|uniref:Inner membrane protein YgaP-like transmembrane domain-containing protein n=1 Tax=Thiohalorhabdus denitrificans TaxID=381306 RepID=A0A0P9GJA7_9GAMM|nr:DUF2892 domain-containing protein [Thiohalorhabdus denitrificans]KPV40168.1 hypothetical protein AN478_08520 [Thiohalorhabdus denitrificans]SCY18383.1 Protein of unknown function [Thiohalorhabdus denitrificans]